MKDFFKLLYESLYPNLISERIYLREGLKNEENGEVEKVIENLETMGMNFPTRLKR